MDDERADRHEQRHQPAAGAPTPAASPPGPVPEVTRPRATPSGGALPSGPASPSGGAPAATPSAASPSGDWHEQRRAAVAGHAAALDADRAAEAAKAGELLTDFVRQAAERGLTPGTLSAKSFDGRTTHRTKVRGWYLKRNKTVAVGEDGGYYVLTVPASLRARFSGAEVRPSIPRLVVGAGGGDGETVPLAQLLQRRLDAGVTWP